MFSRACHLLIVDDLCLGLRYTRSQNAKIWVRFASSKRLDILEINCTLDPEPDNTNRWSIASRSVDRASHHDSLPFGRNPDAAGSAARQREPIFALSFSLEQVCQLDVEVAKHRVNAKTTLVNDLETNNGCSFVGNEELVRVFPCG